MKRYKKHQINDLVCILKNDGVISVPTDTVYGLCARVNSKKAYENLVIAKNRPSFKKFPIMCINLEQIKSIAQVDKKAEKLINTFMPGPITLILNKKKDTLNNGGDRETDEIAIRMAPTKILKELIEELGSPIFMTSANQNGEEICKTLDEIEKKCPLINGMMEGDLLYQKASTIVDCTQEEIKIQREGPISKEEILDVLKSDN